MGTSRLPNTDNSVDFPKKQYYKLNYVKTNIVNTLEKSYLPLPFKPIRP